MSELKDLVTSLELSKKLAEAGFKCESVFCWAETFTGKPHIKESCHAKQCVWYISAYTLTELLEWLRSRGLVVEVELWFSIERWRIRYNGWHFATHNADTPQESAGELVLWCLEK